MDLRRLRDETRPEHEATEATLPLTAPGLTLETYRRALERMLPVVESWEQWAAAHAPAREQRLLAARRRGHLLREDLRALGGEASGTGTSADEGAGEPIDWDAVVTGAAREQATQGGEAEEAFVPGFLGAMYVMEGSTLGGRYIARHVEEALGLLPGRGNAYFQGHGEKTGSMWREVTAVLGEVPEEFAPVVISAARRAFRAFGAALQNGQEPGQEVAIRL